MQKTPMTDAEMDEYRRQHSHWMVVEVGTETKTLKHRPATVAETLRMEGCYPKRPSDG